MDEDRLRPALMRLNRYISNSGVCSRRRADELILKGLITVNDVIITRLGSSVLATDIVKYNGKVLSPESYEYVLLNKPKDFITTTNDPQQRKIVTSLIKTAADKRLYPVGRLDRNSTGLLLLTNDGMLARKLSHPSAKVEKIYHVLLDKPLMHSDFVRLAEGVTLEDGFIRPDEVAYPNSSNKQEVGISLHSGRNRIVRRIFAHMGYQVEKLDRVLYHNLTKKDLPRGKWRRLTLKEVNELKNC